MIEIIQIPIGTEDKEVIKKIKTDLKERGLYSPSLMYRGINVDNKKLEAVCRHGTDRYCKLSENQREEIIEEYYQSEVSSKDKFPESHFDPEITFLLPEKGLYRILREYIDGPGLPAIVVYKPNFFIVELPGHRFHGQPTSNVPRKILEDDALAHKFIKGKNPVDSLVAVYRI